MKSIELMRDIRDRVLEDFEKGEIPFEKCHYFNPIHNFYTKKHYTGVNNFMLNWLLPGVSNYGAVIGFHQARDMGLKMKKGSKALLIAIPMFIKEKKTREQLEKPVDFIAEKDKKKAESNQSEPEKEKGFLMFKTGYVFPMESFRNFELYKKELEILPLPVGDFIKAVNADIKETIALQPGVMGFYHPLKDYINVLPKDRFTNEDSRFMTILHELIHWTGHKSRLDRFQEKPTHEEYIKEEIIAEFGSAMLCRHFNFQYKTHHSKYLKKYFKALNENKTLFFKLLNRAGESVDFLMGKWLDKTEPIEKVTI